MEMHEEMGGGKEEKMSVLVKGMEMPTNCGDCPLCYDMMECSASNIRFFKVKEQVFDFCTERHPNCPLVPAADVVERKTGKWTLNKDGSATCSECGRVQQNAWDMDNADNFCHFCGARMEYENGEH